MPQGMVKSLVFIYEKHLKISNVDTWVIAVLSHLKFIKAISLNKQNLERWINKDVKEQRVDGSSNSSYDGEFVRCTLVAGKPVFGRKIHFHSDITNYRLCPRKNSNIVFTRCIYSNNSVKNMVVASSNQNKVCEIISSLDP